MAKQVRRLLPMPSDAFWEFERTGWNRAAARYEECWSDTTLFVEQLLDAAGVGAGTHLLDLASGPGYVSASAADRGADPLGVDVSEAMVELARARRPGLEFVEGDAERLHFDAGSFDAVTMNFGILHLSRPETALAEARRVLVPEGRFAFTAWVEEGNAPAEIVNAALAAHAVAVELPEGPPFFRFADPDLCRAALTAAGFDPDSIAIETVTAAWRLPDAELLFEAELHAGVRIAAVLGAQPPERLEAIRAHMAERVRRFTDGEGFILPVVARVISARSSA